jgi:hypothetical protein
MTWHRSHGFQQRQQLSRRSHRSRLSKRTRQRSQRVQIGLVVIGPGSAPEWPVLVYSSVIEWHVWKLSIHIPGCSSLTTQFWLGAAACPSPGGAVRCLTAVLSPAPPSTCRAVLEQLISHQVVDFQGQAFVEVTNLGCFLVLCTALGGGTINNLQLEVLCSPDPLDFLRRNVPIAVIDQLHSVCDTFCSAMFCRLEGRSGWGLKPLAKTNWLCYVNLFSKTDILGADGVVGDVGVVGVVHSRKGHEVRRPLRWLQADACPLVGW